MADLPLVIRLQQNASSAGYDLASLLREALVAATKLNRADFRDWINSELQGYAQGGRVPPYRHVRAELKAHVNGLVPFMIPPELADLVCDVELRDPIGSLVHALAEGKGKGPLIAPLSPKQEQILMGLQGTIGRYQPVRTIARNQVAAVLEAVRTTVLEWALRLEQEGILGEGLVFSSEEKKRAGRSQQIRIQTFQGILGDVTQSTVSQQLSLTVSPGDLASLKAYLASLGIEPKDAKELEGALKAEPEIPAAGRFGPRVSAWLGKLLGKAASGGLKVGIAVAGNLLTKAIEAYYGL